jgi:hypothetical protein
MKGNKNERRRLLMRMNRNSGMAGKAGIGSRFFRVPLEAPG